MVVNNSRDLILMRLEQMYFLGKTLLNCHCICLKICDYRVNA